MGDFDSFDYSAGVSDANDFNIDWSNTYTDCSPIEGSEKVTCPGGINIRWTKNFITPIVDGDAQLSVQDACIQRPAFGFVYEWEEDVWNQSSATFPYGMPYSTTYQKKREGITMNPVRCQIASSAS